MAAINGELTEAQVKYYVVGGSVNDSDILDKDNQPINDSIVSKWVEDINTDPAITTLRRATIQENDILNSVTFEEDGVIKNPSMIGTATLTAEDAENLNPYWVVGGIPTSTTNTEEDPDEDPEDPDEDPDPNEDPDPDPSDTQNPQVVNNNNDDQQTFNP